jgi:hypothetical protein
VKCADYSAGKDGSLQLPQKRRWETIEYFRTFATARDKSCGSTRASLTLQERTGRRSDDRGYVVLASRCQDRVSCPSANWHRPGCAEMRIQLCKEFSSLPGSVVRWMSRTPLGFKNAAQSVPKILLSRRSTGRIKQAISKLNVRAWPVILPAEAMAYIDAGANQNVRMSAVSKVSWPL